jgi:hypothetical protein
VLRASRASPAAVLRASRASPAAVLRGVLRAGTVCRHRARDAPRADDARGLDSGEGLVHEGGDHAPTVQVEQLLQPLGHDSHTLGFVPELAEVGSDHDWCASKCIRFSRIFMLVFL